MEIVVALIAVIVGFILGVIVNLLGDYLPEERYWQLQKYYQELKAQGQYDEEIPQYFPDGYQPTWWPHYRDGSPRPLIAWSGLGAFLSGNRVSPNNAEAKMGWRYPLTELGMIGMFALTVLAWPNEARLLVWLIYIVLFALITVIDIEHRLILFYQTIIPGAIIAILFAILIPADIDTADYFIGGAVGYGTFWLFYMGGNLFSQSVGTDEVAFGYGDVTLALLCGLMIGWQLLVFAMMITVFLGAFGAFFFIVGRTLTKGNYSMFTPLPYGPYVVLGTLIMMLGREDVATFFAGG